MNESAEELSSHWALSIQAQPRSLEPSEIAGWISAVLPELSQVFSHTWQPRIEGAGIVAGLSVFASSAQLSLVLHTWPEHAVGSIDLFFSGAFDVDGLLRELSQRSGWRLVITRQSQRSPRP